MTRPPNLPILTADQPTPRGLPVGATALGDRRLRVRSNQLDVDDGPRLN